MLVLFFCQRLEKLLLFLVLGFFGQFLVEFGELGFQFYGVIVNVGLFFLPSFLFIIGKLFKNIPGFLLYIQIDEGDVVDGLPLRNVIDGLDMFQLPLGKFLENRFHEWIIRLVRVIDVVIVSFLLQFNREFQRVFADRHLLPPLGKLMKDK